MNRKHLRWLSVGLLVLATAVGIGQSSGDKRTNGTTGRPEQFDGRRWRLDHKALGRRVNTIADLALLALDDGDEVSVLGYTTPGDAGDPWGMIYRATGRPGALNGFAVAGPGADDWWEASDQTVAYPEQFGAIPDDSSPAAIAANDIAFAAAIAASRRVTITKSSGAGSNGEVEYYLSAPLSIPQHHSLVGPGWRRARLRWDTTMATGSALTLNGTNAVHGLSFFGPDEVGKHGLYIQAEGHGRNEIRDCHFAEWDDGIRLHRAQLTAFQDCYIGNNVNGVHFINNSTSGEGTDGAVNSCLFQGGEIYANTIGVLVHGGTSSTTFRNVGIQGNTSKGVRVYGPEGKRAFSILNCYLESNGTQHIHVESDALAYLPRFENNGFLGSALSTTDKITIDQSYGAVIRGNYFTDDLGTDITLGAAARDSVIELGWKDQLEPVSISGTGTRTRWINQDTDATAAQLASAANAINTIGKHTGRRAWDTTNGRPVWASGPLATDVWVDKDGTTVHTPI